MWRLKTNLETPRRLEPVRRHLVQASNVLVTINSAVNFIVYCMVSRKFRELLVRHCCCCCITSSSSVSVSSVSQHQSCGCWRVRSWYRQRTRRDSWWQSDANDSRRSSSEPRSHLTTIQLSPAQQLTLLLAPQHHHQQQQQQQQQQRRRVEM